MTSSGRAGTRIQLQAAIDGGDEVRPRHADGLHTIDSIYSSCTAHLSKRAQSGYSPPVEALCAVLGTIVHLGGLSHETDYSIVVGTPILRVPMVRPESCIELVGGSPVRVGVAAPGSSPRSGGEISWAERGVEGLFFGGSKRAGRSVMRSLQPRQSYNGSSRADHVPAKAMSAALVAKRVVGFPGVGGVARAHSSVRNRRGPSARLFVGQQDRPYKPMAKSGGAQRESEGAVVVGIGVQQNAPGAKGPRFDRVCAGGKR